MGRTGKKTTKAKKLIITFDEEARRNYLTGFSKRKKLRKKQARADEMKKELAKRKEKRAEQKSILKQTMMRYNLLDTESPLSCDDKPLSSDVTTQEYSGTTVTISGIPVLEGRTNNNATSCAEEPQMTSDKTVSNSSKSSQQSRKLRNKSEKKLRKLKKWNCL